MDWLQAPDYWLSRLVFERFMAALYLIAFLVALNQFCPLLGERGLLPAPRFLQELSFSQAPSLFHWRYSDRFLKVVAWTGIVLSGAVLVGLVDLGPPWLSIPIWLLMWALYLSIVNIGQIFYSFGWESLLLEIGLLTAFFGGGRMAPPTLIIWLLRWTLFRLEFGAGLIKLRGDRCWRDLTCLYYHQETQPMPNPLSWYFHRLPQTLHKIEVAGNHFAQLLVPFGLFAPQPVAAIAAAIIVITQGWLIVSGNFAWLNFATIGVALVGFDDNAYGWVLPKPHTMATLPTWWQALSVALAVVVIGLSYWPVRNLLSRRQMMNFSFNRYHFVNAYGAFGSITKARYEIVLEGTDRRTPAPEDWMEYEFKGKPGNPRRRSPQVAPYHLRLDWLMWFAAMSSPLDHPWLLSLIAKLLAGDHATLRLLGRNPFSDRPPTLIRAQLYRYRFSTLQERRDTGAWWVRSLVGEYVPALRFEAADGSQSPVGRL